MKHVAGDQEMSENDLQEVCKLIKNRENQVNSGINFNSLAKKLQTVSIESARNETIEAICNMTKYLCEANKVSRGDLFERITKRLE